MTTDEIVKALRSCSNHDTRKPDCENCPLFGERLCVKKMLEGGANLIEKLQAELGEAVQKNAGCVLCKHEFEWRGKESRANEYV